MARVEAAIYSILSSNAGVVTLVSTRIYSLVIPQTCRMPAISYARVSTERESAFITDPGLSTARIQVDVWGETISSVQNISEAVRSALHRYKDTIASVVIDEIHIENETVMYEPETEIYHVALDFLVLHRE